MTTSNEQQRKLSSYYKLIMGDPEALALSAHKIRQLREDAEKIEDAWNSAEESLMDVEEIPKTKNEFLSWYLMREKKINTDILFFVDYMRYEATAEQVAYYICMEEMVDGSFDDLMAIAQIGMPINCKMIAAENYWDEMGNGDFSQVHTAMFKTSSNYMRQLIANRPELEATPIECLMNGNILLMWALRREYNVRLIGAMGLVEGSAPVRFGHSGDGAAEPAKKCGGLPQSTYQH